MLQACDSLGLFVLDELAGWQDYYDTETGKRLIKQILMRDVNHPSIILWDNGNEGGWNYENDDEFAKLHAVWTFLQIFITDWHSHTKPTYFIKSIEKYCVLPRSPPV